MINTIYFDESGFTGYNLLDPCQPIFAIASSDVDEQRALDILKDSFPRYQGAEFKFNNIWNSGNRNGLHRFAHHLSGLAQNVFSYVIDKRFVVPTKIVDFLIEPLITNAGFDFYDEGFCRKYVNYIYFGITEVTSSPELYVALTEAYQAFSRNPTETTLAQLQWQLGVMANSVDARIRLFFEQMASGAQAFNAFYDLTTFKKSNELQLTSMLAIISHWRNLYKEYFAIAHDASSNFLSAEFWGRITSSSVPPQMHRRGDGSLTEFPLRVRSTTAIGSAASRSIQFCDIVAGLSTRYSSPHTVGDDRKFIDELVEAGLGELSFNGIRPEPVFPDRIPPKPLAGPDVVDQMTSIIFGPHQGSSS